MHVVDGVGMRKTADIFYVTAEAQKLYDLRLEYQIRRGSSVLNRNTRQAFTVVATKPSRI